MAAASTSSAPAPSLEVDSLVKSPSSAMTPSVLSPMPPQRDGSSRASASTAVAPAPSSAGEGRPSGGAIRDIAVVLGIDPVYDTDLLHVAEEFLMCELPAGWVEFRTDDGKIYFFNEEKRTTQWRHPLLDYYSGVVFMRKHGFALLEQKAAKTPPTPSETRELAKYFGVDLRREWALLPLVKAAVSAPLPPEWDEFEEDDGETYFVQRKTGTKSTHHPLDAYFLELMHQKRIEVSESAGTGKRVSYADDGSHPLSYYFKITNDTVPEPWVEFREAEIPPEGGEAGGGEGPSSFRPMFYNFVANERTYQHPASIVKADIARRAATIIQAVAKGWLYRAFSYRKNLEQSAIAIQGAWRSHKSARRARKEAQEKRADLITPDVIRIQRAYRTHLRQRQGAAEAREGAAVLIQSLWRGHTARSDTESTAAVRVKLPPMDAHFICKVDAVGRVNRGVDKVLSFRMPREDTMGAGAKLQAEESTSSVDEASLKPEDSKATTGTSKTSKTSTGSVKRRRKRRSIMSTRRASVSVAR